MPARTLLLLALFAPLPALADVAVDTEAVDVSEVKTKLKVLGDGHKHYIAIIPFGSVWDHFFYGDGKTFYQQRVIGGGSSGTESFDRVFWDPRINAGYQRSFDFRDAKYKLQCDKRITEFTPLADAEAQAMVSSAKFMKPRWKHRAYALARDDTGTYYYVDRVREPEEAKSFRLYVGPKGSLKLMKMTNVVSDSEGDMFATKTGQLRLILGKNESSWISGKKAKKLLIVPVEDNAAMIYSELGVYTGQPLGTPCDDL